MTLSAEVNKIEEFFHIKGNDILQYIIHIYTECFELKVSLNEQFIFQKKLFNATTSIMYNKLSL